MLDAGLGRDGGAVVPRWCPAAARCGCAVPAGACQGRGGRGGDAAWPEIGAGLNGGHKRQPPCAWGRCSDRRSRLLPSCPLASAAFTQGRQPAELGEPGPAARGMRPELPPGRGRDGSRGWLPGAVRVAERTAVMSEGGRSRRGESGARQAAAAGWDGTGRGSRRARRLSGRSARSSCTEISRGLGQGEAAGASRGQSYPRAAQTAQVPRGSVRIAPIASRWGPRHFPWRAAAAPCAPLAPVVPVPGPRISSGSARRGSVLADCSGGCRRLLPCVPLRSTRGEMRGVGAFPGGGVGCKISVVHVPVYPV